MSKLYSIIFIIILAAAGVMRIGQYMQAHGKVEIGGVTVKVEIASDPAEMAKGLSGRESLGENRGMLFVFAEPDQTAFWMKDMKFPLDIIWIQGDEIVDIAANLPPLAGDYVSTYSPRVPANYVLEVNAGFTAEHGVKVGDKVKIKF
jgi:hypothetical protein